LEQDASGLTCSQDHRYPLIDGIPVMLVDDVDQTIDIAKQSLVQSKGNIEADDLYLDSLGISEKERTELRHFILNGCSKIDPVVSFLVGATNGLAYKNQIGRLQKYPIPEIPIEFGDGRTLLDVGCSWGRWSIAAAKKGYRVFGIDPSLGAIPAARRVACGLGFETNKYIVGDARYLPFPSCYFNTVFSYSVLQHFSKTNVSCAVNEIGRVLKQQGIAVVQMPTQLGIRCLFQQLRRGFCEPQGFGVRYWSQRDLRQLFEVAIGMTNFQVDCFVGLGLQFQ
jgi:SAM-dependent methyltransferase